MKNNTFAGIEVGCGHAQRDAQVFESLHLQNACEKRHHAVVRGKAVAGNGPARDGSEAAGERNFFEFFDREAAAVNGPNQGANAGSGNDADRDPFFFEDFQHSDVGHAAGKPAAEGKTYGRYWQPRHGGLTGEFAAEGLHGSNDLFKTLHRHPHCRAYQAFTGSTRTSTLLSLRCHKQVLSCRARSCHLLLLKAGGDCITFSGSGERNPSEVVTNPRVSAKLQAMVREISAGGVVIRGGNAAWWMAAIEPPGDANRDATDQTNVILPKAVLALPKGLVDPGEKPME